MKNKILDKLARSIIILWKVALVLLSFFPLGLSVYQYITLGRDEPLIIMIITYGLMIFLLTFFWALWWEDKRSRERDI